MKKKQTFLKSLLFAILFSAPLTASAQDVLINETNFPDENFRLWLFEQDYGKDGILTEREISGITYIDIGWQNISNLTGIEHFTALRDLYCDGNQLTTLDMSGCTALTDLYCLNNQLTTLDVSGCTALKVLYCRSNQLTTLDVSGCVALEALVCSENQLTALDVSECTALTALNCADNQLTALDVSKNTVLTGLYCASNQLATLDVSNHIALEMLNCSYNQLATLDVSGCAALTELYCHNNQIKGAGMDALIASLPQTEGGQLYVCESLYELYEGNVCTKKQVAAAKEKNWIPLFYNLLDWIEYEGVDDEEMSIAQPATETVDADAPVYTLSGQKVTGSIKGKKGVYIVGGKKVVVK